MFFRGRTEALLPHRRCPLCSLCLASLRSNPFRSNPLCPDLFRSVKFHRHHPRIHRCSRALPRRVRIFPHIVLQPPFRNSIRQGIPLSEHISVPVQAQALPFRSVKSSARPPAPVFHQPQPVLRPSSFRHRLLRLRSTPLPRQGRCP